MSKKVISGAVCVATLPERLGKITAIRVQDGRLVCETESGVPFVVNALRDAGGSEEANRQIPI